MKTVKCAFLFVSALLLFSQIVSAQYNSKPYADGELLVKFKDGTASAAARSANSQFGARVVEQFPDLRWQRVRLPESGGCRIRPAELSLSTASHAERPAIYQYRNVWLDENFRAVGVGFDDRKRERRRRQHRHRNQL